MEEVLTAEVVAKYLGQLQDVAVAFVARVFFAVLAYVVGRWILQRVLYVTTKLMHKRRVEASLSSFLTSLISIAANAFIMVVVVGILGVDSASLVALFASAGVAIGMALSGTLQNFSGGVIILFFRPFKVGDYIEAQGYAGTVKAIQIFNTVLTTVDNQVVLIPNGILSTGTMKNYSQEETRRVDLTVGVSYGQSFEEVKAILLGLAAAEPAILKDPETVVVLAEMADSSVNVTMRAWVKTADYWPVRNSMNEKIYATFNEKGITIPFPQMDVHLVNEK